MPQRRGHRMSLFGMGAMLLHVVWAVLVAYVFLAALHKNRYHFLTGSGPAFGPEGDVSSYMGVLTDPISAAAQLGRLDLISIALTVLGAVLAVGTLLGFLVVRRETLAAAEETASAQARVVAPMAIAEFFRGTDGAVVLRVLFENYPGLVVSAIRDIETRFGAQVGPQDATDIARVMGGIDENGP